MDRETVLRAVRFDHPEVIPVSMAINRACWHHYPQDALQGLRAPTRAAGCVVHMHSDGDVRALAEDLLDCGVDVLNLQDLVNGIDWIREHLTGRLCVDLDVDRQQVTRFGTPAEIDALIRTEVETLGDPAGGLMLHHGLMPGLPLENVRALMDAMEAYATFYSG
jgi:uroporphyrinogen decarboxylase